MVHVNIPSIAHGPLIGKVWKEGVGFYTNYTNDRDIFVTFPQKWGWTVVWAFALERMFTVYGDHQYCLYKNNTFYGSMVVKRGAMIISIMGFVVSNIGMIRDMVTDYPKLLNTVKIRTYSFFRGKPTHFPQMVNLPLNNIISLVLTNIGSSNLELYHHNLLNTIANWPCPPLPWDTNKQRCKIHCEYMLGDVHV